MSEKKEGVNTPSNDDNIVSLSREEYDKLVEERANDAQAKSNLTNEIKELREKKQEIEEELKTALEKPASTPAENFSDEITPEKIAELASSTVKNILMEKESELASKNKSEAFEDFIKSNKRFHPENDEAGLKRSALEKKLKMFNTDSLKSREEFLSVLESASKLLPDVDNEPATQNPSAYTSPSANLNVDSASSHELDSRELKLIDRSFGGNKEEYLKQKAKRPDYVEQLLEWAR